MELPEPLESTIKQLNKWKWPIITIYLFYIVAVVTVFRPEFWPDEFGFAKDESVTTTSEKDPQGTTTKRVETTKTDPSKTLWDWLNLLGAPITLAIFGYWLQQIQQERANQYDQRQQKRADAEATKRSERDQAIAEAQRELTANETNEDILQVYFDRLSTLLIDKNLMAIVAKSDLTVEENQLVASAADVVRARTLSILRRFGDDGKLKASVIRFLIEAEFIIKLEELYLTDADLTGGVQLSNANLTGVQLSNVNLTGANLTNANLTNADLSGAILTGAILTGASASLVGANLNGANLSNADLFKRDLTRTTLNGADLSNANLTGAQLFGTDLSSTTLNGTHLSNANLTGAQLFGTDLRNAILNRANLTGADFTGANLTGANLTGANLTDAILTGANLTGANLTDADLTGANLTGAILALSPTLTGAAILIGAANLTGADLTNAILTGAKDFSPQQIKSAKNWEAATYNGKRLDDPEVITWLGLDAES